MVASTGLDDVGATHEARCGEQLLSVVVITQDEAARIGQCLASIFAACESLDRYEVVLVDSRSSDDTVAHAREYPVTILELPADGAITPSAARYVGTAATSGDLLLFVDGDMVLETGWLDDACRRVREDPTLAGVDGHLEGLTQEPVRQTDVLRGVVLYDRTALLSVGGFDPHLHSMEDIDLSYRLAAEGYRLRRFDTVVADHPASAGDDERARRWRNGYYHGRGELFRKYRARPRLFVRLAYRTRLYVAILAWLCAGPVATLIGGRTGAVGWIVATAGAVAGSAFVRGPSWPIDKVLASACVFAGLVAGARTTHPAPETYPIDRVETVQSAEPPVDDVVGPTP